jgi:hypothetical protein
MHVVLSQRWVTERCENGLVGLVDDYSSWSSAKECPVWRYSLGDLNVHVGLNGVAQKVAEHPEATPKKWERP